MPLLNKGFFELKTFQNQQMQEETFSEFPSLLKNRCSKKKKNSIVINPLPENLIHQARLTLIRGEERRNQYHTWTDCHTLSYLPSILLRVHLSFLKIICSAISDLSSLLFPLLRWHINSQISLLLWVFTSFCDAPMHIKLRSNKFVCLLFC